MRNRYKRGQHNVIDDITGFKEKSGRMRKLQGEQKGLLTKDSNWNPAHPQLKIRARKDKQTVPNVRTRQTENFITTPVSQDDL